MYALNINDQIKHVQLEKAEIRTENIKLATKFNVSNI